MNKTCVILNPTARGERARRWEERLRAMCGDAVFCATARAGDAEHLARSAVAEGFEQIVAAGGDGTIHEVVNGIAGSDAALGLMPMGTMNVFATELGLPANDLGRCWEIIQARQTRLIDLPMANEKHFVQLAGVGLDAQVGEGNQPDVQAKFRAAQLSHLRRANRRPPPAAVADRIGGRGHGRRIVRPRRSTAGSTAARFHFSNTR